MSTKIMTSKHTPGTWSVFICDDGGQWTGWPLSINTEDPERTVVRPGGFYPYEWDRGVSQLEACANAHLIASAPAMLRTLQRCVEVIEFAYMNATEQPKELDEARAVIAKAEGKTT